MPAMLRAKTREWLTLEEMDKHERYRALSVYAYACKRIRQFSNKIKIVADIGCGPCFGVRMLASSFTNIYFIGLDIDPEALVQARRFVNKLCNVDLVCADATMLPFRKKSLDLVTAFELIEHLDLNMASQFLHNVHDTVKVGLILSTPDRYSSSPFQKPINPHHRHEFYHTELLDFIEKHGFMIYDCKGIHQVYRGSWLTYAVKSLIFWVLPKRLFPQMLRKCCRTLLRKLARMIRHYLSYNSDILNDSLHGILMPSKQQSRRVMLIYRNVVLFTLKRNQQIKNIS